MNKKITYSIVSFVVLFIILIIASIRIRQAYSYSIDIKDDINAKKTVDTLRIKMTKLGYTGNPFILKEGNNKSRVGNRKMALIYREKDRKQWSICLEYGVNTSIFTLTEKKNKFENICKNVIDPELTNAKIVRRQVGTVSESNFRYQMLWFIDFKTLPLENEMSRYLLPQFNYEYQP